jgi:hypothetical protein
MYKYLGADLTEQELRSLFYTLNTGFRAVNSALDATGESLWDMPYMHRDLWDLESEMYDLSTEVWVLLPHEYV